MSSLGPPSSSGSTSMAGANIMEAWLIKGLRLLYSQKPEDAARLRRFYREACENESQVLRTSLTEALRESRDESSEHKRDRISASSIVDTIIDANPPHLSDHSDSGSSSGHPSTSKRPKVGFFNIFDPTATAESGSKYRANVSSIHQSVPTTAVVVCQGSKIEQSSHPITTSSSDSLTSLPSSSTPSLAFEEVADLVADLVCCVCGRLTAQQTLEPNGVTMNTNAQVECSQCCALYHQMCHDPPLLGRAPNSKTWFCSKCTGSKTSSETAVCEEEPSSIVKGGVLSRRKKSVIQQPVKIQQK